MIKRRIFALIHGPYGTGKTTLANTIPGPRLVLDAEGGSYDVDKPIVTWDPREPVPADLGKDDTIIVDIRDWETYRLALDVVESGNHPFASLILDSLTEIQKQLKDAISPETDLQNYERETYDVWGKLLSFMEKDIRRFRDLSRPSSKKPINVVIVAASNVEEVPRRPVLQGALRRSLPGFVDLEGYLHVEHIVDAATGSTNERYVLDIHPNDASIAEVKCRLRLLKEKHGSQMWDPDLTRVLRTINPRPSATNKKES